MTFSKQRLGVILFAIFVAACVAAYVQDVASTPAKSALDKPTLEAYVRHLFVWGAQIEVKISDPKPSELPGFYEVTAHASAGQAQVERSFYVSKDGRKIIQGAVYDIQQNPFQRWIDGIKTDSVPGLGKPGAPVTVIEFSDFQCPFCKDEAKMLRENLVSSYPEQVRLYFKHLPLEQIHPWSKQAAIAGQCVFRQNPHAFWEYHDWIFGHQSEINLENLKSKVLEFAGTKQIDVLLLGRCLDTKATEAEVNKSVAEARSLQVNSTPTIFINGRMLTGRIQWPQLRGIIDFEIEYQKTAGNAPDETGCEVNETGCEVKLPSPLTN
jgi:protein-disulfide isomerase